MSDKTQKAKPEDFEIVDRPTGEANSEEGKHRDILEALLSGKCVEKKIETSRGKFTARYPLGRERLRIDRLKAIRRGGIPASSFDDYAEYNNNVWSTLDVLIVDGPGWYKKAKEKKPGGWSWEDEPDEEFVVELFNLVRSFRSDVAEKIRRSEHGKDTGKSGLPADTAPVDDGAFSGLTNGPEGEETI